MHSSSSPCGDFGFDVTGQGDDRRAAQQLPPGLDHATIEVIQHLAHVDLAGETIEAVIEPGILRAKGECGGAEPLQLFRFDLATDPPVGIVRAVQPWQRLARAGQVVEIAAADRLLNRDFDHLVDVEMVQPRRGFVIGQHVSTVRPGLLESGLRSAAVRDLVRSRRFCEFRRCPVSDGSEAPNCGGAALMLGAGWPVMQHDLGVPVGFAGIVTMIIAPAPCSPVSPRSESLAASWLVWSPPSASA